MITRFLAAAGRHRRAILVVGLVVSAGYLLIHLWVPSFGRQVFRATTAATGVFLLLGLVAVIGRRPMAFVVQPRVPAFNAPPQPFFLFMALAFLSMTTSGLAILVRDWRAGLLLPEHLWPLSWAAVLVLPIALTWRDTRVQLRPDGVWQRGITGWLVIPWDALPAVPTLPPTPTAHTVGLRYGRPELVRRRGLHIYRRRLHTEDIDPRLLCAAIRYYLAHPEHRPAIGTQAEYERVLPLLRGALDWSPPYTAAAAGPGYAAPRTPPAGTDTSGTGWT